jgi:hypothetical protein
MNFAAAVFTVFSYMEASTCVAVASLHPRHVRLPLQTRHDDVTHYPPSALMQIWC